VASKKYYLNDFADTLIRERYDRRTESINHLSMALGLPRWVIKKRAQMLGLAKAKEKPWSDKEVEYLEAHFPRLSVQTLARKLNRSTTAIAVKAKRLGIRKSGDGYTANSLAQALGVDNHKITRWVELGLIKACSRHTQRRADMYLITDSSVKEFLVNYPTELDLRRADPVWLVDLLANVH